MGGENARVREAGASASGSSPRGRGKLDYATSGLSWGRLIPAWAGKTARRTRCQTSSPAHPRVGGENIVDKPNILAGLGSSPRGRGKPDLALRHSFSERLIPAWAGKTRARTALPGRWAAHPRVGGENAADPLKVKMTAGSSPRGRGKLEGIGVAARNRGLIPAWAGKTTRCVYSTPKGKAHPRVGGENQHKTGTKSPQPGSSPRGRGKRRACSWPRASAGLIPAWAGKTNQDTRPP